jgi:hypothetical protein
MEALVHSFWNRGIIGGIRANVDCRTLTYLVETFKGLIFTKTIFKNVLFALP